MSGRAMMAGRTRDRLQICRMVEVKLPGKSPKLVAELVANAWGRVESTAGMESMRAGSVAAEATHLVETRGFFEAMDEAYRIQWTDRFNRIRWLDVLSVRDVGQDQRKLLIECKEIRADGSPS